MCGLGCVGDPGSQTLALPSLRMASLDEAAAVTSWWRERKETELRRRKEAATSSALLPLERHGRGGRYLQLPALF
jgi:hypothetical protein